MKNKGIGNIILLFFFIEMEKENIEAVFQSQRKFFDLEKTKSINFRKEQLLLLKQVLEKNETALFDAIFKDFGKSAAETYMAELSVLYSEISFFIKNLKSLTKPRKVPVNRVNFPSKNYIYTEPLGVVLIIGAWNYPYQLTLLPLISAIAAGNTCILKPSELAINTMHLLEELINKEFDEGLIKVIKGGIEVNQKLLELPFDKIFFTGSTKIGRLIYKAAAEKLIPVTLELGGKSPTIVTKNTDLKIAVRRIVWGKFYNAGQTCVAPDYVYVERGIEEQFLRLLKEEIEQKQYSIEAGNYVRIINQSHFKRLSLYLQDSIYYSGGIDKENLVIYPTVLSIADESHSIMQEEIFGPILPVIPFSSFDKLIKELKRKEKPLAAYLFSDKKEEQDLFINSLSFGGGCINETIMHLVNPKLPFGGVGASGVGSYHGKYGLDCFSHKKSILKKSKWEILLRYSPYSKSKLRWIKLLS